MENTKFYFLTVFILMYKSESSADCIDFSKKCQAFCLKQSGGVASRQCWGVPKYRFCKCDDMTVYHVPGYPCEHSTCPEESKTNEPLPTPTSTTPTNGTPLENKKLSCKDFKLKCQQLCLKKSGGVATNQCWGNPKYRYCKCDDQSVHNIPGYTCEHPSCPKEENR